MFQNQVCQPNHAPSHVLSKALPENILVVVPSPFPSNLFDPRRVSPNPIPDQVDLIIILSPVVVTRSKIIGIVTISLVSGSVPLPELSAPRPPLPPCPHCSTKPALKSAKFASLLWKLFWHNAHAHMKVNLIPHLSQQLCTSACVRFSPLFWHLILAVWSTFAISLHLPIF